VSSLVLVVMLAQAAPGAAQQIDCAEGRARVSAWDRARAPHLGRYCDFLAQAEVRLPQEPARAEQAAAAAEALVAGQAAPLVLRGRAALVRGDAEAARRLLDRALALDGAALRDPRALQAHAEALRDTGETGRAIEAYRGLLPRIDAIPGEEARTRARLDAALALMLEGPGGLEVAQTVLKDAAERGAPALRAVAVAALALALDRAGAQAQAQAAASEARRAGAAAALAATPAPLGWPVEALAVQARLREVTEPGAAAASWEAYLARASRGPWAAHARARLAEAQKRAPGRKR
jgi:SWI/SNF-related matrix-associated actin-dependent regulator 1 of chromatin subfamily A